MIKKLLCVTALSFASTYVMSAQTTTVFSNNFDIISRNPSLTYDDNKYVGTLDIDEDGNNWQLYYQSDAATATSLYWASFSYDDDLQVGIQVDNLLVFGPFNFTNYNAADVNLNLDFKVKSLVHPDFPQFSAENYTVYAVSLPAIDGTTIPSLYAPTSSINTGVTTNILDWATVAPISLNNFKGQNNVYISIRHHNTFDMVGMGFDDIKIVATNTASTQDFANLGLSMFPNPASDVLNISANNNLDIQNITITDINGRTVKQVTTSQINVSDLASGTYIVKVQADKGTATSKFIKK